MKMSETRLDPVGAGYHPSVAETEANVKEAERDEAHDNLNLLDVEREKTASAEEYNAESESEKGQQDGNEKPRHVGFWSHELVNVRLHVIKLWCRTGETVGRVPECTSIDLCSISLDPLRLHSPRAQSVQWRLLSHPEQHVLVDRLCCRF